MLTVMTGFSLSWRTTSAIAVAAASWPTAIERITCDPASRDHCKFSRFEAKLLGDGRQLGGDRGEVGDNLVDRLEALGFDGLARFRFSLRAAPLRRAGRPLRARRICGQDRCSTSPWGVNSVSNMKVSGCWFISRSARPGRRRRRA